MQRPQPMNRLLQGDVGAGKTIVALLAALVAMENGLQVAFMAPTEILAEQHFMNITRLLQASRFRVALLTGGDLGGRATPSSSRRSRRGSHPPGGRHARAGAGRRASSTQLGLVVIDEQHRFGVLQRATLRDEGTAPGRARHDRDADSADAGADAVRRSRRVGHPRSAARAPADQDRRQAGVAARRGLRSSCASSSRPAGRRTSIYPLVEESDKVDLKAATEMADHLCPGSLPRSARRPAARPDEGRRQGPRDAGVRGRRARHAGVHDGGRGGRGRAQCQRDGRRARRAVRSVAVAPAARAGGPRAQHQSYCCAAVSVIRCPTTRASGCRR